MLLSILLEHNGSTSVRVRGLVSSVLPEDGLPPKKL